MKRVVALGSVVTALVVAAVAAWVDVLSEPDRPTVAAAVATMYAPPQVVVDPNVAVDQAEVEAHVAHLANHPRGWRTDLDQFTVRIVPAGVGGTQRMPGRIGRAYHAKRLVVISDEAWTVLGPRFASVGGTLDDQRTWIVLHELGHLLGHEHTTCSAAGQPAPLMRPLNYDLNGCTLNVWP